jgi:hypothetical protein
MKILFWLFVYLHTVREANLMRYRSWWFASTAIPLLAATIGPLANILSIAALVTSWRSQLGGNGELPDGADELGVGIPDPQWLVVQEHIWG